MKKFHFVLFSFGLLACSTPPSTTNLFNGKDLSGWHIDIPSMDTVKNKITPFIIRDGLLVSLWKHSIKHPLFGCMYKYAAVPWCSCKTILYLQLIIFINRIGNEVALRFPQAHQ